MQALPRTFAEAVAVIVSLVAAGAWLGQFFSF